MQQAPPELDKLIVSLWGTKPLDDVIAEIQAKFPEFSRNKITCRATQIRRKQGLPQYRARNTEYPSRPWTHPEHALLETLAGTVPANEIAKILARPLNAIAQYASKNGISLAVRRAAPTNWQENEQLREDLAETVRPFMERHGLNINQVIHGLRLIEPVVEQELRQAA